MKIRRTANAGVLLNLDGVSVLLDGVCQAVYPYLATPQEERQKLMDEPVDIVAFTHSHLDHFDVEFARLYQQRSGRAVLGPANLPGCVATQQSVCVGHVSVMPIKSRHIGSAGKTVEHFSFIVQGSSCIWFLGDASPLQWARMEHLPKPDVLIVPHAYAATHTGWQTVASLGTKVVVILHMPDPDDDPAALWPAVRGVIKNSQDVRCVIPQMTDTVSLECI